jgi:hypothetical protein
MAQPQSRNAELDAHSRECALCAEFVKRNNAMEAKLAKAINVSVDSGLASRIMLNHNLKRNHRTGNWMGIAASVVAAIGITIGAVVYSMAPDPSLLTASIEHVTGEPSAMKSQQIVSPQEMSAALGLSGAVMKASFTNVTYLHDCPVPGGIGKHIVLQTSAGKVTLITMPSQKVAWSKTRKDKGYVAVIRPAQVGSYALIAENESAFNAAEQLINQNVTWRV